MANKIYIKTIAFPKWIQEIGPQSEKYLKDLKTIDRSFLPRKKAYVLRIS